MEIELVEISDFLLQHPPFDQLQQSQLNELVEHIEVRYSRRGQTFPPESEHTHEQLFILRKGAVEAKDQQGKVISLLAEGDIFSDNCQFLDLGSHNQASVIEDALIYCLPCQQIKKLCSTSIAFNLYFESSLEQRLQQALSNQQVLSEHAPAMHADLSSISVRQVLEHDLISIGQDASIQQAAQLMHREKVSCLPVTDSGQLCGMITDRDLRSRVVAEARDPQSAVSSIMTADPQAIESDASLQQATLLMLQHNIHHLPVVDQGKLCGIVTATDIQRLQQSDPVLLSGRIHRSNTLEQLVRLSQQLPGMQYQLAFSNVSAVHIGETFSGITDALTCRLIELAQQQLGEAPVPFVWVSGGSQARREQSAHSDQDNALILSDAVTSEQMPYFQALAKSVCDGLNACGFVYCPGNAMAMNPDWCQPVQQWHRYFKEWIHKPEPKALMLSSIFFDLRSIYGDASLLHHLQQQVVKETRTNSLFIAHLAANALTHRPPLGFFRNFVLLHDAEHDNTFDIKHRGIVPVTDIARLLALAEGSAEINTRKRLQAVSGSASLSKSMAHNLMDAVDFIGGLRIRHQARQIAAGEQPDNYLPPEHLSQLERNHLKDAFSVIKEMQSVIEQRYHMY